jgi:hypothetical protein
VKLLVFVIAVFSLSSMVGWRAVDVITDPATSALGSSPAQLYNARTDFAVVPVPNPVPIMGGATGAGNMIVDPDFGSRIYRLTDIDTIPGARYAQQQEWHMNCGGWGDSRVSNLDSTKILICDGGAGVFVLPFDPSTGKAGTASALQGIEGSPEWSKTQSNIAFASAQSNDPRIMQLDFSVLPPKMTLVVNLAKVPNCAEQFAGVAVWRELSAAWDDATFAMAVGKGTQGSAHMVYVWDANTGCQAYDTEAETVNASQVRGGGGSFFVHSIKISGDGKVVMVSPSGSSNLRRFWHVGTTEVDDGASDGNYGHFAVGYRSYVNAAGHTSNGTWCKLGMAVRSLTALLSPLYVLTSKQCADTMARGDDHVSWNDDDTTDTRPFATSTVTIPLGSPITAPWQNEILVFMQDGIVHREAHTFNSGKAKFFACQNAIGSISQDGEWFFYSSDWEGTLGTDRAGNSRCDDFAVKLH